MQDQRVCNTEDLTTSAISMLIAKHTKTTTSFTMTTAIVNEEKGPLPSVSFSTAICVPKQQLTAVQTLTKATHHWSVRPLPDEANRT